VRAALAGLLASVAVTACTATVAPAATEVRTAGLDTLLLPLQRSAPPAVSPTEPPQRQLPRGGRTIFPGHVVVAFYGTAGTGALGVLGETGPDRAAARVEKAARPFGIASGRKVLPAFELITTVADRYPGDDGDYSAELDPEAVGRYLQAARKAKMLLILDFQPGRAEFLDQVKRYERFLLEPEVGVALDPEWKLTADQLPLRQIGTSTAAQLNAVSSYLANLMRGRGLPEKVFMIHQFKSYQLPDRDAIVDRPGLATVLHVDGFGPRGSKLETYGILHSRNRQLVNGFKLFYDEDTNLFSPAEALRIVKPQPELFSYQ
jgi:hypothetical protein